MRAFQTLFDGKIWQPAMVCARAGITTAAHSSAKIPRLILTSLGHNSVNSAKQNPRVAQAFLPVDSSH